MSIRGRRFEVDQESGKLLGVCAGLANRTGVDATIIRVGVVLAALLTSALAVLILYLVAGFVGARRRGAPSYAGRLGRSDESRERMRNLDLRMQAIETYVTSSNSRLAREIEDLR